MPKGPQGLRVSASRGREGLPDRSSPQSAASPMSPASKQHHIGPLGDSTNGAEREYSAPTYRQAESKAIPRRPIPTASNRTEGHVSGPASSSDIALATEGSSITSEHTFETGDDQEILRMDAGNRSNSSEIFSQKKNNSKSLLPGITRTKSGRAGDEQKAPKFKSRYAGGREGKKKTGMRDVQSLNDNPLKEDRKMKEAMNWNWRNRSADRSQAAVHNAGGHDAASERHGPNGNNFLTNFQNHSSRVVGGIERAGRGFAGMMRFQREESSPTRGADPRGEHKLRIINLPLVEQTRLTRITKTLPECMDKTEFWMPALVWRCIDFLNSEACMSEGIYRQSGSFTRVKHYAMRFDTELDIDLLSPREKAELGDVNIIASLFKMWIREQPTQVIPQEVQDRVMSQWRADGEKDEVPQQLRDELSQLPPYHYYLLFAITCHISLVYACREENKMSFHNLHICFAPGLKVDHQVFKWLIEHWRECWQGCLTEDHYIKEESRLAANVVGGSADTNGSGNQSLDERAGTAHSSRPSTRGHSPAPPQSGHSSSNDRSGIEEDTRAHGNAQPHGNNGDNTRTPTQASLKPRGVQDAPMLSPVKRLDPLGDFMS